ncbi:MAG: hypothetical protein JXR70_08015 [Spirochaetales bacterium]|nr:hypothetical protein [Spirochaetales bacterium]
MKNVGFVFTLLLLGIQCMGDPVFGPVADILEIEGQGGLEFERPVKSYELLIIQPGKNTQFLTGFQIEIIISDNLKRYSDNFAIDIYGSLSPAVSKTRKNYQGERIFSENLPRVNRLFINIPFGENRLEISSALGTYDITRSMPARAYPLALTIQPITKGLPSDVLDRAFYTIIKPIVEEKGILNLALEKADGLTKDDFDILIDNIAYTEEDTQNLVLKSGIHQLVINSQAAGSQLTNFTINAGQTTELKLKLQPKNTTLVFDLLEGAVVYLNGKLLDYKNHEPLAVEEGLNTIIIKIGNQKMTRKIEIKSGKSYNIALILDLDVKEY